MTSGLSGKGSIDRVSDLNLYSNLVLQLSIRCMEQANMRSADFKNDI